MINFKRILSVFVPKGLRNGICLSCLNHIRMYFKITIMFWLSPALIVFLKKGAHTEYYPRITPFVHDFFHFNYDEKDEQSYFQNLSFGTLSGLRNQSEIENIIKMMKSESDFDNLRDISALNEKESFRI